MFSLGIKNAILVMLIIMILHVLIKNAIADGTQRKQPSQTKRETFVGASVDKAYDQLVEKSGDLSKPNVPSPEVPACPAPEKKTSEEDELLKYVYGDDKDGSDIASFFKGLDVTKDIDKNIQAKLACPVLKSDDNSLPLSTTCDPKLQNMSASLVANKEVKADCDLKQPLQNMVLKEYNDESSMNGGALYGSLSAYDDYALSFQEYDCGTK